MPDVNGECEEYEEWMRSRAGSGEDPATQAGEEEMSRYLEQKITEARRQQESLTGKYPYMDGGRTVIAPEVSVRGGVLSYKGVNYVPQEQVEALLRLRSVCGVQHSALGELLHDSGVRMNDGASRVYALLLDGLTLALPALAEKHPVMMPRLPKGMP